MQLGDLLGAIRDQDGPGKGGDSRGEARGWNERHVEAGMAGAVLEESALILHSC